MCAELDRQLLELPWTLLGIISADRCRSSGIHLGQNLDENSLLSCRLACEGQAWETDTPDMRAVSGE